MSGSCPKKRWFALFSILLAAALTPYAAASAQRTAPRMVVVDEQQTVRDEPPPHGAIGMSTAYRISDGIEGRTMEFRKRVLHPGAAIGPHRIAHDEVYYVLDGEGEVTSDGERQALRPGSAAYLFDGAIVGITQQGARPLTLIIAYPLPTTQRHR